MQQKTGRLELADQGTLFLPTRWEYSIEIPPKLLRLYRNVSLKRLGSNRTKQVDVDC